MDMHRRISATYCNGGLWILSVILFKADMNLLVVKFQINYRYE